MDNLGEELKDGEQFAKYEGGEKLSLFKGEPDARQSQDIAHPVSRFRPTYRALTAEEKALHDAIKDKAAELEVLYAQVKPGRYNSLAVTALEQSVMWVVKELTA